MAADSGCVVAAASAVTRRGGVLGRARGGVLKLRDGVLGRRLLPPLSLFFIDRPLFL